MHVIRSFTGPPDHEDSLLEFSLDHARVSTLFGFMVNLYLDLAFGPLWKIFTLENLHLGTIINTHSCRKLIQMSSSSSSSSSTVTITSVPRRIRVGQVTMTEFDIRLRNIAVCRYFVPENRIAEVRYQGEDLHYHRSTLHLNFGTHKLEGITIEFCYRAFRRITNGPPQQYVYRKTTFVPAPRNIIFCQYNEDRRRQPNGISIV